MKIKTTLLALALAATATAQTTLKEALASHCLIGAAVNQWEVSGEQPYSQDIVKRHFNQVVAENCMKGEVVQPEENKFDFTLADEFMAFAEQNNLAVVGHCLVWHSQPPKWIFTDKNGNDVSREVLIDRMKKHIKTVVGRYRGQVKGWDVVNEMMEDDGQLRKSPYYRIIGPDYIEIALKTAHEADPDAELYLNDYSMAKPGKREAYVKLITDLKAKGCRIDAMGMQSHNGMDYPNLAEYEKTLVALAATGVKVMITELDLNCLPNPQNFGGAEISQNFEYQEKMNPYAKGLSKKDAKKIEERMLSFFKIYRRHSDKISRITLWGVNDSSSWLNDWPIKGRTNYPLLFNRDGSPKPVVQKIIDLYKQ